MVDKKPDNPEPHEATGILGKKTVVTLNGQDVRYYPVTAETMRGVRKQLLREYAADFRRSAQSRIGVPIEEAHLDDHITAARMRFKGTDPLLPDRTLTANERRAASVSLVQGLLQRMEKNCGEVIDTIEWRMGEERQKTGKEVEYVEVLKAEKAKTGSPASKLITSLETDIMELMEVVQDNKNILLRGAKKDENHTLHAKIGEVFKVIGQKLTPIMQKRRIEVAESMNEIDTTVEVLQQVAEHCPDANKSQMNAALERVRLFAKERTDTNHTTDQAIFTAAGEGFDAALRDVWDMTRAMKKISGKEEVAETIDYGAYLVINLAHLGIPHKNSLAELQQKAAPFINKEPYAVVLA